MQGHGYPILCFRRGVMPMTMMTLSFIGRGSVSMNMTTPFPFPEEEGELLRGGPCRDMATPSLLLEEGGCL